LQPVTRADFDDFHGWHSVLSSGSGGVEVEQLVAIAYLFASTKVEGVHRAIGWGMDGVLHFHGFQNQQRLALAHLLPALASKATTRPGIGAFRWVAPCTSSALTA
jgi:hypothetical protein